MSSGNITSTETETKKDNESLKYKTYKGGKKTKKHNANITKNIRAGQAKAMKELGLSENKIAQLLDVSRSTIKEYVKLDSKEIEQVQLAMRKQFLAQDYGLNGKAVKAINQHLSDKDKMSKTKLTELTGLYRTTREFLTPQNNNSGNTTNLQINISRDTFDIEKL